jgi:hypothetical protein
VGGEEGVSVGGGTLGVLVGIGVSVAAGAGVKVGLGVLVGVGAGVGAPAINEVSGHPRHPNALPKTDTAINIINRDLFIVILFSFSSQAIWLVQSTSDLVFGIPTARIIPYFTGNTKTRRGAIFSAAGTKYNTLHLSSLKFYPSQALGLEF